MPILPLNKNYQLAGIWKKSLKVVSLDSLSLYFLFSWGLWAVPGNPKLTDTVSSRGPWAFYVMLSRHGNSSSLPSMLLLRMAKGWCLWREVEGKSGPFMGLPLVVIPACHQLWVSDFLQSLWHSVFFPSINSSGFALHPAISGHLPNHSVLWVFMCSTWCCSTHSCVLFFSLLDLS